MRCVFAVTALSLAAGLASAQLSHLTRWSAADGGNNHLYGLTTSAGAWTTAQGIATAEGGSLVSINTAAESEFIRQTFLTGDGADEDFWIGLSAPAGVPYTDPDNWQWNDGSTPTFQNWLPGQPDLGFGLDRYAAINFERNGSDQWANYPNIGFRVPRGIVEIVPCNVADLAAPYGLLDLADVVSFSQAFLADDSIADLVPTGLLDLADIVEFVERFLGGCP